MSMDKTQQVYIKQGAEKYIGRIRSEFRTEDTIQIHVGTGTLIKKLSETLYLGLTCAHNFCIRKKIKNIEIYYADK